MIKCTTCGKDSKEVLRGNYPKEGGKDTSYTTINGPCLWYLST